MYRNKHGRVTIEQTSDMTVGKGVSNKMMKLAGRQLDGTGAAVFVLADDAVAASTQQAVFDAGVPEVKVEAFPAGAEGVVEETLTLG